MSERPPPPTRRKPLDRGRLEELALRYVGRFATSRAKLRRYLQRKIRERGWEGGDDPDLDALAKRLFDLGYVDDRVYANAKADQHVARGLGRRRLRQSLTAAGISEDDGRAALERSQSAAIESAVRHARRRRLGPFADKRVTELAQRQKAIASFVRAGHDFDLSRTIVDLDPRPGCDLYEIVDLIQHTQK